MNNCIRIAILQDELDLILVGRQKEIDSVIRYIETQSNNNGCVSLHGTLTRIYDYTNLYGCFVSYGKHMAFTRKLNKELKKIRRFVSLDYLDGFLYAVKIKEEEYGDTDGQTDGIKEVSNQGLHMDELQTEKQAEAYRRKKAWKSDIQK